MDYRDRLAGASRIVVKVGTSTITQGDGSINTGRIAALAEEFAALRDEGRHVLLVTSGAIAAGVRLMGLGEKPKEIHERQAMAAAGQVLLMHAYATEFKKRGMTAGQVLLTRENSVRHNQYRNSRSALLAMLSMGIVPVVNENDAVSVDEIRIGDNDTLSATVASLVDADLLILLSDIDGLYTKKPTDPGAELIPVVHEITPEVEHLAGGAGSALGTGGMVTKIEAAKIAVNAGVTLVIAPGAAPDVIRSVVGGRRIGTVFPARESHIKLRKRWLAFGRSIEGALFVDDGCARAMLTKGSSLLAAGIVGVEGDFPPKSTVRVLAPDGREIARGVTNFGAAALSCIMGKKTEDVRRLAPEAVRHEVIHRDDMVIMA